MHTAIAKWGNSLALRLPRHVAEGAGLFEGTAVDLQIDGERLVVTPSRPKYKLADLLANHNKGQKHDEVDWGQPRGEEAW